MLSRHGNLQCFLLIFPLGSQYIRWPCTDYGHNNKNVRSLAVTLYVCGYIYIYYIDTNILLENIPLVKFIKTTSGTRVVVVVVVVL